MRRNFHECYLSVVDKDGFSHDYKFYVYKGKVLIRTDKREYLSRGSVHDFIREIEEQFELI